MLGSMLTNLLFVFGLSCLVGGIRWQVQELRITSGNVSVGLLLVATAGSLLPAALSMSGELRKDTDYRDGVPSESELKFCRVNAVVMILMYLCYLLFQLGTHKEEFDDDENIVETPQRLLLMTPHFNTRQGKDLKARGRRNAFFLRYCFIFFYLFNCAG
jgi:Ca2+:H+ antiporter